MAWPTSGTVKIEGYSKTVPLTVKGEQVGLAVITPDGATITFNDKVEKLSDVSGFAEFEVQGRNLTQTNTSDDKVATITSGNKSTNVTVHKSEAEQVVFSIIKREICCQKIRHMYDGFKY